MEGENTSKRKTSCQQGSCPELTLWEGGGARGRDEKGEEPEREGEEPIHAASPRLTAQCRWWRMKAFHEDAEDGRGRATPTRGASGRSQWEEPEHLIDLSDERNTLNHCKRRGRPRGSDAASVLHP